MPFKTSILREIKENEHGRVTFVELFFDLVFVFAVTQISHGLLKHFTLLGALEALLLLMAVWWVWIYTSWATNWLDPEKIPVRLMLFAVMLAGLVLTTSLPEAFGDKAPYFAVAYVAIQIGRTFFAMLAMVSYDDANYLNFKRIISWLFLSGIFWLLGGFGWQHDRIFFWAIALAVEFLGPAIGYYVPVIGRSQTSDWHVEGSHFAERCGLFIIIALGESVLVIGATMSDLPWTPETIAAFLTSFTGSVAMWWLYFNVGMERGSQRIQKSHDPGRHARNAYTYLHLPIVAGIIVAAVADEKVLAHPMGHTEPDIALVIAVAPLLYIGGNFFFKWMTSGQLPRSHLIGLGLLTITAPTFHYLPPLAFSAAMTAILIFVAAWEAYHVRPMRMDQLADLQSQKNDGLK